ncbi:MAG: hypoxanthine phosphoribosyltransferase [Actinobacteria bacterium]|nr:hypoxanthine phosphoribosyltransferase [Actinomycetota bacterium]
MASEDEPADGEGSGSRRASIGRAALVPGDDRRGRGSREGATRAAAGSARGIARRAGAGVCSTLSSFPREARDHLRREGPVDSRVAPDDVDASESEVSGLAGHVEAYEKDIEHVLISEREIQDTLKRLGAQITEDYRGKDLVLVGVLKGAFMVMSDLSRHVRLPLEFDFMAVSSYGAATQTSGVVRILKDLDHEIEGRDVLLVEDIVDSGLTLKYLLRMLAERRPGSLEVFALLQKTDVQQVPLQIRYVGFEIPPVFVVGYGLDFAERFRNLPYVATLKPEAYRDVVGG